jgi:hypothetical protein
VFEPLFWQVSRGRPSRPPALRTQTNYGKPTLGQCQRRELLDQLILIFELWQCNQTSSQKKKELKKENTLRGTTAAFVTLFFFQCDVRTSVAFEMRAYAELSVFEQASVPADKSCPGSQNQLAYFS